jgi:hypothetical protein
MAGSNVGQSQTAATSFWSGSTGQTLIKSLNGGSNSTNLGNWLATICPNFFGNLQGQTNASVASYVKSLSSSSANAQVLATALAAYVTDSSLVGSTAALAQADGFTVTAYGVGVNTYNVGSNGSALGLTNNTSYSIITLLEAIVGEASNGVINYSAYSAANTLFAKINGAGGIS